MKLNPFTRGDTPARREATRQALTASEAKISALEQQRSAAVVDSDDVQAVTQFDIKIAEEQRVAAACRDRLAALEARAAAEAAAQHTKNYEAAVALIERLTPMRETAAVEVEEAVNALAASVRKFCEVSASIAGQWPESLGSKPSYHLGSGAVGELVRNCFASVALVYSTTKVPPPASDFVRRACDANERAAGFADATRADHAELLADLRGRGVPDRPPGAVAIDGEKELAS